MVSKETAKPAQGQGSAIRRALRLRQPMAIGAMVFALLGIFASGAGTFFLTNSPDTQVATHPITALCLFGVGFWAYRMRRFGPVPLVLNLIAGLVLSACTARVMAALVTGWSGATPAAVYGPLAGFQGQFSTEAALALGAFSAAALLRQNHGRTGMLVLGVGLAVVYNAMLEVSYGVTFFDGQASAFTLFGLLCAATSMVSVYVNRPFVRIVFLRGDIGSQTRVMAAAAVGVPLVAGFVLYALKPLGSSGFPVEAAITSAMTWSMLVLLLTTSARLENASASRRRALREIAMQSRIDPLTKALNRFGMMETLEGAWVDFRSTGAMNGLILIDLDYFERLNATFGHDAGDDVLSRVSATLQPHLRDTDALGYWGGGEFLILLKIKQRSDLNIVANRLRRALEDIASPFGEALNSAPVDITASFGLSEMLEEDHGPSDAITRADIALHMAKDLDRDRAAQPLDNHDTIAA